MNSGPTPKCKLNCILIHTNINTQICQLQYNKLMLIHMKSSDAKASECHLKFSSRMIIFIKLVYLSSVISLKWQ